MRIAWLGALTMLQLVVQSAVAALVPVGPPVEIVDEIVDEFPCFPNHTNLEVVATPKGAFIVLWGDDQMFELRSRRFSRQLLPTAPPQTLLPVRGEQFFDFAGEWAGLRYELVINLQNYNETPSHRFEACRVQLDLEGESLGPASRVKTPRFVKLAPANGGDSLQFRVEPPAFYRHPTCLSFGLLARRIDISGNPLSIENRVNRKASAWDGGTVQLQTSRLADDSFVTAYTTCDKFTGVVARRMSSAGAPVGKPINLPLPGRVASLRLAASGSGFAIAATVFSTNPAETGGRRPRSLGRLCRGSSLPTACVSTRNCPAAIPACGSVTAGLTRGSAAHVRSSPSSLLSEHARRMAARRPGCGHGGDCYCEGEQQQRHSGVGWRVERRHPIEQMCERSAQRQSDR
jgi:hypothetical protein